MYLFKAFFTKKKTQNNPCAPFWSALSFLSVLPHWKSQRKLPPIFLFVANQIFAETVSLQNIHTLHAMIFDIIPKSAGASEEKISLSHLVQLWGVFGLSGSTSAQWENRVPFTPMQTRWIATRESFRRIHVSWNKISAFTRNKESGFKTLWCWVVCLTSEQSCLWCKKIFVSVHCICLCFHDWKSLFLKEQNSLETELLPVLKQTERKTNDLLWGISVIPFQDS